MKPNAIVVASDRNMLPAACCALLSFKRNLSRDNVAFYLLGVDLDSASQRQIDEFCTIHGLPIQTLAYQAPTFDASVFGRWSHATIARLYLNAYIPAGHDKLLYIDADVFAQAPVDDLFAIDLTGTVLGAVDDYLMAFPAKMAARQRKIGMRGDSRYFNAGVLLLNWPACLEQEMFVKARQAFEQFYDRFEAHDQDALNLTFEGRWKALSPKWNTQTGIVDFVTGPVILHFTGKHKPWQKDSPFLFRDIKKQYVADLKPTAWRTFCRDNTVFDLARSAVLHAGKQITERGRIGKTRSYFQKQG